MSFWARFRYYLIGVSIGVMVSFFFFRGRGCAWLPENRVKNEILESVILYTDAVKCQMKCNNVTEADIFELFYSGNVNFSESSPNENPKLYVLEGENFKATFAKEDTISVIREIRGGNECDCKNEKDILQELKLPESTAKKMIGKRPLELNDLAQCQKDCYDLSEKQIETLIGDGNFMEEASNRRKRPYPELFFEKDGFQIVIELTQETARIINIVQLSNPDCGCY